MNDDSSTPDNSAARRLAILGALITGGGGTVMAVYSAMVGEETAAGAMLAASALAFGLLAANVDRAQRKQEFSDAASAPGTAGVDGRDRGMPAPPSAALANGDRSARPGLATEAQIEADPITGREREVLSLVAKGNSNKQISAQLGISERTVKNHLTTTMTKLRASDRAHAVVTAVRLGWLEL